MGEVHILIVGTGAVGAFYGSRLHRPERGIKVSFVCRSNYEVVKKEGLRFETYSFGDYHMKPFKVFKDIRQSTFQQESQSKTEEDQNQNKTKIKWDYIILCTKVVLDQIDDSQMIQPIYDQFENLDLTSSLPCLVLIQNGIGFEEIHRRRFKSIPILSAVTTINSQQIKPGLIKQNRWTRISIGPYYDFKYSNQAKNNYNEDKKKELGFKEIVKVSEERLNLLVELFKLGGIKDAEKYDERELQIVRWHKLAINASMNPTSILSGGQTNQEMLKKVELKKHIKQTMNEILKAGQIIFQISDYPIQLGNIDQIIKSIERSNLIIKSSMLIDWENNNLIEIEVILGILIKISEMFGIHLNRVHTMYSLLIELQNKKKSLLVKKVGEDNLIKISSKI